MDIPKNMPEADQLLENLRGKGLWHWDDGTSPKGDAEGDALPIHTECGGQIREIDRGERSNRLYKDATTGQVHAAMGDPEWEFFEWDCDECGPIDLIDPPQIKEWY